MSTTTAIIVAVLALAALVAVIWSSFWLRDLFEMIINDPETLPVWKVIFFFPFLALWIWCFLLEILLIILAVWMAYDTAKEFRDWWHKGAR